MIAVAGDSFLFGDKDLDYEEEDCEVGSVLEHIEHTPVYVCSILLGLLVIEVNASQDRHHEDSDVAVPQAQVHQHLHVVRVVMGQPHQLVPNETAKDSPDEEGKETDEYGK